ncbi:5479_t:CDS:1 [Acaulospora morrowiae]|uniref:5479_t:CDS:1 n=1 Tax=Acaulospora morrowiae TaxID=94023 RepID=A0A9N8VG98_9GLOM|nr:5479_t:CDS:1 [Acaulospora morrowiae]
MVLKKKMKNIFHHNKNSSVAPNEEWKPSFVALDLTHPAHSHYSHYCAKPARSNKEPSPKPVVMNRASPIQRRHSYSDNGQQRLAALKQAEYAEKMRAFEDLIQKRRGSTLRVLTAPDVSGC